MEFKDITNRPLERVTIQIDSDFVDLWFLLSKHETSAVRNSEIKQVSVFLGVRWSISIPYGSDIVETRELN